MREGIWDGNQVVFKLDDTLKDAKRLLTDLQACACLQSKQVRLWLPSMQTHTRLQLKDRHPLCGELAISKHKSKDVSLAAVLSGKREAYHSDEISWPIRYIC